MTIGHSHKALAPCAAIEATLTLLLILTVLLAVTVAGTPSALATASEHQHPSVVGTASGQKQRQHHAIDPAWQRQHKGRTPKRQPAVSTPGAPHAGLTPRVLVRPLPRAQHCGSAPPSLISDPKRVSAHSLTPLRVRDSAKRQRLGVPTDARHVHSAPAAADAVRNWGAA
jgi:hypothetical protein